MRNPKLEIRNKSELLKSTLVQNLPWPLFAKEGEWFAEAISPFEKRGIKGDFLSGTE